MMAGNGQHEIKQSFYHLDSSCRSIATKFGKPDIAAWTNGDYIRLSSILSRATSVQVSPNTLKRIFGKLKTPERYYPQKATRDALVQYLGYNDWETFVISNPRPIPSQHETKSEEIVLPVASPETEIAANTETPIRTNNKSRKNLTVFFIALICCVLLLGSLFYFLPGNKPGPITNGITFTCKNPEGKNPHSAVFSFQADKDFTGDLSKFTISFGDGRAEKAIKSGIVMTHFYEIPGRYFAELRYDGKALDTIPVYLRTDGWTATARVERDSIRVYPVIKDSLFSENSLAASSIALLHAGVDTTKTFYVDFVNTRPTDISGDNFELSCKVNTSEARAGVRCSQIMTVVYGETAVHKLFLMKPGCEAWTNLSFSEFSRNGAEDDLNFLAADFSTGGNFKLRIENKQVSVFINNVKIYTAEYAYPVGNIYGLKISFAGIGKIHDIVLRDLKTGVPFNNGFIEK